MKSTSLIATVALAIVAIYLGESFKSVDSKPSDIFKKVFGKKSKEKLSTTLKRDVCAECGLYDDEQFLSTVLLVQKVTDPNAKPVANTFAVLIGSRTALSAGGSFWRRDGVEEYHVYYPRDKKFTAKYAAPDATASKPDKRYDDQQFVLITLSQDITDRMVPACLPKLGSIEIKEREEFKIPFILTYDGLPKNAGLAISLGHEDGYKVKKDETETKLKLTLKPYVNTKIAFGGAVTKEIDGRLVLYGIIDGFMSKRKAGEIKPTLITIYKNKALELITKHAEEVNVEVCTMSPKPSPVADDKPKPKPRFRDRFNPKCWIKKLAEKQGFCRKPVS